MQFRFLDGIRFFSKKNEKKVAHSFEISIFVNWFRKLRIVIEKIKKYYQRKAIGKVVQRSNRPVKGISFNSAKYIGILYPIEEEKSYVVLSAYVDKLMAAGKTLRIVGYHDNKYVPFFCIPKLKYDFFCQKEQNWVGIPNAPFVEEFVNEPFDMLVDLSLKPMFPLTYILAKSAARFKVGSRCAEKEPYLDMMIELNESHTVNDLMSFINDYTNKLNGE